MSDTIFQFFGLREDPFRINPDPRFLFSTLQSRAIADELAYGISNRKGLILLSGEVGTGKTMLLRHLLDWLAEKQMPTALIVNSHIRSEHLINLILNDFGVPCTSTYKSEKLLALNAWLLERYRTGQIPVLIVDEAQGLEPATLEEIRLLLNLETPREKLLQVVLAGQSELETKLKRHELRQLRQRIAIRCRTAPLTLEQTSGYIRERLKIAGANGNLLFEADAVASVHAYSRGIPRVINALCEHSLINACADGVRIISSNTVECAAHECQLDRAESIPRVLNTSSYSTTPVSDVANILATVSASSEPTIAPGPAIKPSPLAQIPTAPQPRFQHTPRAVAAAEFSSATVPPDLLKENPISNQFPLPPVAGTILEQAIPPAPTSPVETESVPTPRVSPTRRSPFYFLHHWARSFAADARASAGQFRRAVHSFEVRTWNPFVHQLRHEVHKVLARASRLFSDPRWKQLRVRAISTSQASLQAFKSAALPWVSKPFSIHHRHAQKRAQGASGRRPHRPRAITTLRKWLHEPLTSQRKRMEANQRR